MGAAKDGGYIKQATATGKQSKGIDQFLKLAQDYLKQSGEAQKGYLPGGKSNQAVTTAANNNFNQETLPSIMNAFGSGAKSSSALNQALAAGASNLNTNIAAQNSQTGLQAAQGLGSLGSGLGGLGTQSQFAYSQRQQPFWQSALLGGINAAGSAFSPGP